MIGRIQLGRYCLSPVSYSVCCTVLLRVSPWPLAVRRNSYPGCFSGGNWTSYPGIDSDRIWVVAQKFRNSYPGIDSNFLPGVSQVFLVPRYSGSLQYQNPNFPHVSPRRAFEKIPNLKFENLEITIRSVKTDFYPSIQQYSGTQRFAAGPLLLTSSSTLSASQSLISSSARLARVRFFTPSSSQSRGSSSELFRHVSEKL